MNNNLYKPKYNSFYFLFETKEDAVKCVRRLKKDYGNVTFCRPMYETKAKNYAADLGRFRGFSIKIIEPGEIFLILDCHVHGDTSIYHCIVGEQTGWVPISTRFEMIKIQ